ncbi:MAG TPA: NAD(P)/FAD-dependent oxidoreductase [Methylocella sp.]|nr:NAD(P)/FAD-dependent oxidoreductase [Methylocella sp.]
MLSGNTNKPEVVVVGAGAAGLGAAVQLAAAKLPFVVLEARERVGGRAYTMGAAPFPLDLGCGWLHSADRNPWTKIAAEAGFTIDKTTPGWGTQSLDLGFSAEDQAAFAESSEHFYSRLEAVGPDRPDIPAADLLEPGCRFNPLLNAVSTYVNGVELDRVSVQDSNRYADTGINWRVVEGYGAAIAAQAVSLPVRLDCQVTLIDHRGHRLKIETSLGTVTADAIILTIPTPLIATQAIRFRPDLTEKIHAASVLPLGLADKLVIAVDKPGSFPAEGHLIGNPSSAATGSYHLRPFGRPLIEAFFGGRLACELEVAEPGAFFDFAATELVHLLGSDIRGRLHSLVETGWGRDPFALGSYSHALPGYVDARATLAAPVDGRIFFAGEACSRHNFTTAHGAYLTGVEAAEEVIALAHFNS